MSLDLLFERVAAANCTWHGLYQGRTEAGGHTNPAKGYDPNVYGAADWNVRLRLMGEPNDGYYGYGGGPTLEAAVNQALEDVERNRAYRRRALPDFVQPKDRESVTNLLKELGL